MRKFNDSAVTVYASRRACSPDRPLFFRHRLTLIYKAIKRLFQLAGWLAFICLWMWMGFIFGRCSMPDTGYSIRKSRIENQESRIPSIEEIQTLVGARPDGKIGPETMAKWNRAVCDQYNVQSMRRMAKK
jgi:hypothetical protein